MSVSRYRPAQTAPKPHHAAVAMMLITGAGAVACNNTTALPQPPLPSAGKPAQSPFGQVSTLPYSLPPFDQIRESDFRPAFEQSMAQQRRELNAIGHNAEAPSFDNTIVALEHSGQMLARVSSVFSNLTSANTSDELVKIQREMAPRLSAHQDAIYLDPALYARIDRLYQDRARLGLDAESLRLLVRYRILFARAGAKLSDEGKEKLRTINQQLSSLMTQFEQTLLKANNDGAVVVDQESDLDGLPPERIAAAAETAKSRKLDGKWVIPLHEITTFQSVLTQLKNRQLRERIYRASIARGNGGPDDTTVALAQIIKLRADKATLLGYRDFAAYMLEEETAGTVEAVNKMLAQLVPTVEASTRRDGMELQELIDTEAKASHTRTFRLQPWDWPYYAEQLRKQRYDFDEEQIKPYFELNHVLQDGVFYAAHQLYGLTFKERTDLPVYHKDVRVFEVFDRDGSPLAVFLADYFARDNKNRGAWMDEYVGQSRLLGLKSVVVNCLNIPKPPEGQPVLLGLEDTNRMFHEFGHALHSMFSNVQYPLFGQSAVPPDFIEYPSQFNEMWSYDPQVLAHYAKHYQTGAPIPQALLTKVLAVRKFSAGYKTRGYLGFLGAAILDQSLHQIPAGQTPDAKDMMAFEATALSKAGVDDYAVPPYFHAPYFGHIFAVNTASVYAAGFYAYIWSDVLAKDTEHWMNSHGGLQRANGDALRAKVLSHGFSTDPLAMFVDFYGKPPELGPLLEARGLTVSGRSR